MPSSAAAAAASGAVRRSSRSSLEYGDGFGNGASTSSCSRMLYASHALSRFGDRMWEFAIPIMFVSIYKDTLLPAALFSLGIYSSGLLLLPLVGRWVDVTPRIKVVRTCVYVDNVCTAMVCGLLFLLIELFKGKKQSSFDWSDGKTVGVFVAMLALAVCAEMAGRGSTLALERDWVVVIAGGDKTVLARLNARMRRIDLVCKFCGPMVFGFLMQAAAGHDAPDDMKIAVTIGTAVVAAWNALTAIPEYALLRRVHAQCEALQAPRDDSGGAKKKSAFSQLAGGWRRYVAHPVFGASFSYSMLYFTVLDGGTLMTAYLQWTGISPGLLGASRGVGAVFGIIGTLIFPWMRKRRGGSLRSPAVISHWLFFLQIAPIAACYMLQWKHTGYFMLGAVVVSRWALWSFDLACTQIMQECVSEGDRGTIGACQAATYQLFWMLLAVLGIVYHDPAKFHVLVYSSVAIVGLSVLAFTFWAARTRAFETGGGLLRPLVPPASSFASTASDRRSDASLTFGFGARKQTNADASSSSPAPMPMLRDGSWLDERAIGYSDDDSDRESGDAPSAFYRL